MDAESTTGLFHRDVRLISRLVMRVDGRPLPLLTSQRAGPASTEQVFALTSDPYGSPTSLLRRRRQVATAMVDHYVVETFEDPIRARFELRYEHDLTDVLRVKKGDLADPPPVVPSAVGWTADGDTFGIEVEATAGTDVQDGGGLAWDLDLPPASRWEATVVHRPRRDGEAVADHDLGLPSELRVRTGESRWSSAVASAIADRDALRVSIPELELAYLGAGVPWFMALFGRDTLITALESAIGGSAIGLDVAEALARYQGKKHDPRTGEEPGRILHELRTGGAEVFGIASGTPYYGTVDASPLFVMLLGELHRWGADPQRLRALLPAARAAVSWCLEHGDVDGDGFVEYVPDAEGLTNQGWKDSGDAMVHADGSQAKGAIALAEVQAYLFAALRDLARLEEHLGDPDHAAGHRDRAAQLREAFTRAFWNPEQRIVAMALDGDKAPLEVPSSNMGHVLWAGILDDRRGGQLAERLVEPDLFSGWGIRTLASSAKAYSPLSYHRGSVWPHDSALGAAGLARYGRRQDAAAVGDGLLEAAAHFGWRLPELFGGQGDDELPFPVPYPVACSPQAWSASVPLLLLRLALGLEPDLPNGTVRVAPWLPDDVELHVSGIELGGAHLAIRARGRRAEVLEAPEGLDVVVH
jgi:glycogen debranching enzyme